MRSGTKMLTVELRISETTAETIESPATARIFEITVANASSAAAMFTECLDGGLVDAVAAAFCTHT